MKLQTHSLFVRTLKQMGCKCHVDGNEIRFSWQGEVFLFPQITDKQHLVRVILERLFSLRRYLEMAFDKDRHGKRPMSEFEKEFPFMAFSMKWDN